MNLDNDNYHYHWANEANRHKFELASYVVVMENGQEVVRGGNTTTPQVLMCLDINTWNNDAEEKRIFQSTFDCIVQKKIFDQIIVVPKIDIVESFYIERNKDRKSLLFQDYGKAAELVFNIVVNTKRAHYLFRQYLMGIFCDNVFIVNEIFDHDLFSPIQKYLRQNIETQKWDYTPFNDYDNLKLIIGAYHG